MFLQTQDYQTYIKGTILTLITQNTENIRTDAELAAQAQMESYLKNRYDVTQIFNIPQDTNGQPDYTQRNHLIVMYLIDISLYHIHARMASQDVPEIREIRYNAAIDWLKAVAAMKISPNLPELPTEPPQGVILWGSEKKRNNRH